MVVPLFQTGISGIGASQTTVGCSWQTVVVLVMVEVMAARGVGVGVLVTVTISTAVEVTMGWGLASQNWVPSVRVLQKGVSASLDTKVSGIFGGILRTEAYQQSLPSTVPPFSQPAESRLMQERMVLQVFPSGQQPMTPPSRVTQYSPARQDTIFKLVLIHINMRYILLTYIQTQRHSTQWST